ncbi:hypothetical protein DFP72DRAFT_1068856 [Ephemerocybe angulata]|uniref:Uncharacterized protein n=1 Tax=Ephemerocybe angulata TaxID=980116 RepID=A0A8H6HWV5_9AGAR|nr:hypothetical protein DFP72DRAFT_1068856 [Tulosesus angulatus]
MHHYERNGEHEIKDEDVELLVAGAKSVARHQRWPLVKCAFFGTNCTKPFIVPAAIQVSSAASGRAIDVEFRSYLNVASHPGSLVQNLDLFMIEVKRYPANTMVESPWRYTIFTSRNYRDEDNKLIQTLYGGQDLAIHGSVLVAKTDHMGAIQPVFESDMGQIETMLVETLITRYRALSAVPGPPNAADILINEF